MPQDRIASRDWLLLLLAEGTVAGYAPGPLDRVRVQKALFVLGETLKPPHFYDFTPYHYGPFCSEVYRDAEALVAQGLAVDVIHNGYKAYAITAAGQHAAEAIRRRATPQETSYLGELRRWVEQHSFNSLVRTVYATWPEMRARSIFRG